MVSMVNLTKEQKFEVVQNKRIGHYRTLYQAELTGEVEFSQWFNGENNIEINEELAEKIALYKTKVLIKYNSFNKISDEADKHYGKEVDVFFNGLNYHVDLFDDTNEEFNVWIRMLPQLAEYNLYIYFYEK